MHAHACAFHVSKNKRKFDSRELLVILSFLKYYFSNYVQEAFSSKNLLRFKTDKESRNKHYFGTKKLRGINPSGSTFPKGDNYYY